MINDGKLSPLDELRNRLATNKLEDEYDCLNYWQYASRLAALGDDFYFQNNQIKITAEMLKERCRRGIREVMELDGEELALSIIDAQDFHCFEIRRGTDFSELTPYFAEWQDVCEHACLDDDAADLLRGFKAVFGLPESELIPVVNTPISQTEYTLLHHIYKDVELPVVEMVWKSTVQAQVASVWQKPAGDASHTITPTLLLSCDDDKPSDTLKNAIDSNDNHVDMHYGIFVFARRLGDTWKLKIFVEQPVDSIPIARIRAADVPAFQDGKEPSWWSIDLSRFDSQKRKKLLEAPIVVQLENGTVIECKNPV